MPKRSKRKKSASDVRRSAASLEAQVIKQTTVVAGLAHQSEQLSVQFIKTELELGLTFAQGAQSYKDPQRRKQATDRAAEAYRTVVEKLSEVHPGQQDREQIEEGIKKLEVALKQLPNSSG
jgi:hypothetical protein